VRAGGKAALYGTIGGDGVWLKERLDGWGVDTTKVMVAEEVRAGERMMMKD